MLYTWKTSYTLGITGIPVKMGSDLVLNEDQHQIQ